MCVGWGSELIVASTPLLLIQVTRVSGAIVITLGVNPVAERVTKTVFLTTGAIVLVGISTTVLGIIGKGGLAGVVFFD